MAYKAPGQAFRKGISLIELFEMFPDDATAEQWFIDTRWTDGIRCVHCGSERITDRGNHPKMRLRCKDCRRYFSVKMGTVMESSNIGFQKWAIAIYLMTTNLKGVSSMKLHRDLGIAQSSAWHMVHRIRASWKADKSVFGGEVEVDEAYFGGSDSNRHAWQVQEGRGAKGKTAVVGMRERETGKVQAEVVGQTDKPTLQGFITERTDVDATIYTDGHRAYQGLPRNREWVEHSVGEFVRGRASTNGVESFWAMLKRGYQGVYHKMSPEHLHRYITEFEGRHNWRSQDTETQMCWMVQGMGGKRLRLQDLIAHGRRAAKQLELM